MSGWKLTRRGGKVVDVHTAAVIDAAERKLGYDLTIVQGSPNRGVSASGGTHDGQGVIDLAPFEHERKVRVLRELGCAAWYRPELWRNGVRIWGAHIHAVVIGHRFLSPAAARQVTAYLAGRDGLAGNGPDNGPDGFRDRRFPWPPPTRVELAQRDLAAAARRLDAAATKGGRDDVARGRRLLAELRRVLPRR